MLKELSKIKLKGDIIITDPLYIVKHDKLEDESSKPVKSNYYPSDWIPPTEEDYFNNTEKALAARRYEQQYNDAIASWRDTLPSDWDVCNYGEDMQHLGFTDYIFADTIYGPWSCTTFTHDCNIIGKFTSDSGLVGVFLLSDIIKYNPSWDLHLAKPYCATMIPQFNGVVKIVNAGGCTAGDSDIRVIGMGSHTFYTKQTGF